MLKSINSPDDHHGHLRNLIDQRNARVDVHGQFSSAVSDFSNTPSVYSHAYFSPGESRVGYPYSTSISLVGPERYEPRTSMLDLTDDRSLYVSGGYDNANTTSSEEVTDESETVARMSYLGPRMRVHSRAPWEEEALQEVDEENIPESPRRHGATSIVSAFSSPRPSFAGSVSRQSGDSSMSQLATPQSFETINSQVPLSHTRGGLYSALAQESTSSNSLGRRTPVKETFLNKLSIGRLRSDTSTTINAPNTPPIPSPMSSPVKNLVPTSTKLSPIRTNSVSSSSHHSLEFLPFREASTHPYANPDLVVSYPGRLKDAPAPSDTLPHCDSELTVTESFSMALTPKYNAQARVSIPDSSRNSKFRTSPISTKSISSPVTAICSPQNLRASAAERSLPGWTERSSSAPFALISLEEARAKRMRTSTDTGATLSSSDPGTPFPGNSTDYTTPSSLANPARGRSISAGANAKNALHSILGQPKSETQGSEPTRRDDFIPGPPSGKTLKNKKSGFMRIFNRDKDLQSVPPVPSIPDGISQSQSSRHLTAPSTHRTPLPSLLQPGVSIGQSSLQSDILTSKSVRRPSPSLSINTTTQGSPARTTTSSRPHLTLGVPSAGPQSAPADHPEFPVLKLRPVSTLFSSSFADLVPSNLSETPDQGAPRPHTPPSSKFPITPISPFRPPYDSPSVINDVPVKALQEQMLSAKNAWQRHIWELEGQVRDLKSELEQLKNDDEYCDKCGRGPKTAQDSTGNRHQTRSGTSRFVNPRT